MKTPSRHGFTLIELMTTLSVIAVITILILPRFLALQESARYQVAIDQVNAIRNAVSAWGVSVGTVTQMSTAFGPNSDINPQAFNGSASPRVIDFLDQSFLQQTQLTNSSISNKSGGSPVAITGFSTPLMRDIPVASGQTFNPVVYNGATIDPVPGISNAHIRIYWPNDANRLNTEPAVLYFAPPLP